MIIHIRLSLWYVPQCLSHYLPFLSHKKFRKWYFNNFLMGIPSCSIIFLSYCMFHNVSLTIFPSICIPIFSSCTWERSALRQMLWIHQHRQLVLANVHAKCAVMHFVTLDQKRMRQLTVLHTGEICAKRSWKSFCNCFAKARWVFLEWRCSESTIFILANWRNIKICTNTLLLNIKGLFKLMWFCIT